MRLASTRVLYRFLDCRSGSYAVLVGILSPVLLGVAGGAIDIHIYEMHRKALQEIADGAALAAVGEAALLGWSEATATSVGTRYVESHLDRSEGSDAVYTARVLPDLEKRRVTVQVEQDHYGYFVVGYFRHSPQIRVTATAQASGSTNVCVIGLDETAEATVGLNSNAVMSAGNCAVYSNSTSAKGLQSKSNSILTAALSCSAGGYEGAARNFAGEVLSDCPPLGDPLALRPLPAEASASCKFTDYEVKDKVATLAPGVYCGGLLIDGNADVRMQPGTYVFRNGPFVVNSNSVVDGTGVGLVFQGTQSGFEFKSNVEVDLEAPSTGEMAGLLVYQDRDAPVAEFRIESKYTRNLLGTLYMPNGHFIVNADNKVADQSAYTAIVARTIRLNSSPNLVLNTDYGATTVPVPEGLGPSSGKVRLSQ